MNNKHALPHCMSRIIDIAVHIKTDNMYVAGIITASQYLQPEVVLQETQNSVEYQLLFKEKPYCQNLSLF
jgi:hypothetical protein